MPVIPIHNETEYDLTPLMLDHIRRDAIEYFGETIRAIRVQSNIERLAFNAKTGVLRYPFFPSDYRFDDAITPTSESELSEARGPNIDDNLEDIAPPSFDDDADADAVAILQDVVDVGTENDDPAFQRLDVDVDTIEGATTDFL